MVTCERCRRSWVTSFVFAISYIYKTPQQYCNFLGIEVVNFFFLMKQKVSSNILYRNTLNTLLVRW